MPNTKIPILARERHGGGPACTAIAAVGTLQGRAAYYGCLGGDDLSVYLEGELQQRRIDTTHITRDFGAAPYHSFIVVDQEGNRNVFYDASKFNPPTCEDLTDSLILSAKVVLLDHVAGSALTQIAKRIQTLGIPVLGDIEAHSESALELAKSVDLLVVPCEFARWASQSISPMDACAYLAQNKRTATVVTAGSDGCYYIGEDNSSVIHLPAFKVDAFDTNGCGDTFHGAFALAIARDFQLDEALLFASAAAAIKASGRNGTKRGWDARPALDDVLHLLRSNPLNLSQSDLLERIAKIASAA